LLREVSAYLDVARRRDDAREEARGEDAPPR
jgi:hypothetical protein